MTTTPYELIRSRRKTISLEVRDGRAIVRAPLRESKRRIDAFVSAHEEWLRDKLQKSADAASLAESEGTLSEAEINALMDNALEYIPLRTKAIAEELGVTYGKITIGCYKTKWGSCSPNGNLSFNCLLMLTPLEVIDSIVVHELCHRKEMNHSKRFYDAVYAARPDYDRSHKWLRDNGDVLMRRAWR